MSTAPNESSRFPESDSSTAQFWTYFHHVDRLVEELEGRVARHGFASVNVNDLMKEFISGEEECRFSGDQIEELAVECLRVWMELAFDAGAPVSVLDALGQLSGIEISSEGLKMLEFECDRLNQSVSSSKATRAKYPEPNSIWGEFSLLGVIGEGAISRVFLARQDSMSDRLVAVKITTRETTESKLLARIQHSGVVPIYSVHEYRGMFGICMPFVGTSTLADLCDHGFHSLARQDVTQDDTVESSRAKKTSALSPSTWTCREIASHLRRRQSIVATWIRESDSTLTKTGNESEGCSPSNPFNDCSAGTTAETRSAENRNGDPQQNLESLERSINSDSNEKWWESNAGFVDEIEGGNYQRFILRVGSQLASALDHVHRCGVVHCDVKPANVLIGWDAQPRLLDFNVSQNRTTTGEQSGYLHQLVGGTPAYMAPEQRDAMVKNETFQPDARVDVFSLGAVLFELLTGVRPPLGSSDRWSELKAILAKPKLSLSKGLQAVLLKALAYKAVDRYQTIDQFGDDLVCLLEDRPLVNVPEPSRVEAFGKWRRRHPRLSSGGSVAMFAASMILFVSFWGWTQHSARQSSRRALAVSQLHDDLPVAASLMSAVTEYDELRSELAVRIQSVHENLELLAQLNGGNSEAVPASYASLAPKLDRLQLLWLSQAKNSGGILSPFYQIDEPARGNQFCREDLRKLTGKLGFDTSNASGSDGLDSDRLNSHELGRFEALFAQGRYMDAIAHAESHPQPFDDYGRLILLAHSLFKTKQYSRASNAYSEAIANEHSFPLAVFYRGVTQLALGDHHQASRDFRTVLKSHPNFVSAKFNLGLALMHLGRTEDAELIFSDVVEMAPDITAAWVSRARLRLQLKKVDDARRDIARALETRPTDCRNLISLSQLLASQNPEKALRFAEQAVDQSPNDLDARQMLAHLLTLAGRDKEAMIHLSHILEMEPEHSLALGGRAVLLARTGKQAEAVEDLGKLIRQKNHDPLLCYQIACGFSLLAGFENAMGPTSLLDICTEDSGDRSTIARRESSGSEDHLSSEDHLRRAMNWYHKAVTADPSIRSVAATDSDLKRLRGSKHFSDFEQMFEDFGFLRERFSE